IGGRGNDTVDGGTGNDYVIGGSYTAANGTNTLIDDLEADTLIGGAGNDTFAVGQHDLIADFNTGDNQDINDGDQSNNDFVDLSPYYNYDSMRAYNAAHGTHYTYPLQWMRDDQKDDGVLNQGFIINPDGSHTPLVFTIQNGGSAVDGAELTWDNTNVACFAEDTLIETCRGAVAIGDLVTGDLVVTRDHGLQPIRWIGRTVLAGARLSDNLRPVRIRAGALGAGLPLNDLVVSPQHRVLVRSKIAQKMFGAPEVLVAAKQLLSLEGIDLMPVERVTYVHMLFDRHEIVISNGAESESLYTGPEALKSVGRAAQEEIFAIFPELRLHDYSPVAARFIVPGRMARKLAQRHAANAKPLVA
ncbi:MAG: Hint domain-containing protein, partial [Paracoccus sp. (in: a-proteobacteria)]|nr:Hint domain-containing protein [Paracoccus sp. (in: a-proteobacteria)]